MLNNPNRLTQSDDIKEEKKEATHQASHL